MFIYRKWKNRYIDPKKVTVKNIRVDEVKVL